jgi:hypothetical protein
VPPPPPGFGGGVERRLVVTAQGDDVFAQARVGRKDAVVAVAVDAGRRDEAADGGEKLESLHDSCRLSVRQAACFAGDLLDNMI